MIKVEQKADNLKDGITNMMLGAKNDYIRMSTRGGKTELTGYSKEQVDLWDHNTTVFEGKKYIKIVQGTGVFAFVMKEAVNSKNKDLSIFTNTRCPILMSHFRDQYL